MRSNALYDGAKPVVRNKRRCPRITVRTVDRQASQIKDGALDGLEIRNVVILAHETLIAFQQPHGRLGLIALHRSGKMINHGPVAFGRIKVSNV